MFINAIRDWSSSRQEKGHFSMKWFLQEIFWKRFWALGFFTYQFVEILTKIPIRFGFNPFFLYSLENFITLHFKSWKQNENFSENSDFLGNCDQKKIIVQKIKF